MSQILYPGSIPSLSVGGRLFTDITNLIILSGTANAAAGGYCSARKPNASACYQVPTGKSYRLMAIQVSVLVIAAGATIALGYQDADVGFGTNTAPTNLVQVAGSGNGTGFSTNAIGITEYPLDFLIPAGKYLYTYNGGNVSAVQYRMFGYEV